MRTPTRRTWLLSLAVLVLSFVGSASISPAFAGLATSATGHFSTSGVAYTNQANVNTSPGFASSRTTTSAASGSSSPGYIGSRGRLFTSAGVLSCEGTTIYNSGSTWYANGDSCARWYSGTWYGYGVSRTWNGGGYADTYTFISPNQNS